MEVSTPLAVLKLHLNKKEIEHRNRNWLGYHVYLSCSFSDFKCLEPQEQHKVIYQSLGIKLGLLALGDNDSINLTDSIWYHHGVSHC